MELIWSMELFCCQQVKAFQGNFRCFLLSRMMGLPCQRWLVMGNESLPALMIVENADPEGWFCVWIGRAGRELIQPLLSGKVWMELCSSVTGRGRDRSHNPGDIVTFSCHQPLHAAPGCLSHIPGLSSCSQVCFRLGPKYTIPAPSRGGTAPAQTLPVSLSLEVPPSPPAPSKDSRRGTDTSGMELQPGVGDANLPLSSVTHWGQAPFCPILGFQ